MILKNQSANSGQKNFFPKRDEFCQQLILTWLVALFGCILFIWSWCYLNNVSGNYRYKLDGNFNGWSQSFFFDDSSMIQNYSRWIMGFSCSIGSILAVWFLSKFGYQCAVCIALTLMVLSFPMMIVACPFKGNTLTLSGMISIKKSFSVLGTYGQLMATKNSIIGYALFEIFRNFLVVGGMILVISVQSIAGKLKGPTKITLNRLIPLTFSFGVIVATVPFILGLNVNFLLVKYWYLVTATLILLTMCLLVFYLFCTKKNIEAKPYCFAENKITYLLKNRDIWKFAFFLGIFVFIVLFPTTIIMKQIIRSSFTNSANFWNSWSEKGNKLNDSDYEHFWYIWKIIFFAGSIIGYFFISSFSKTNYKRKKFLLFNFLIGFIFLILSLFFCYQGYNQSLFLYLCFLFSFLSGVFLIGIFSVVLLMIHELPDSTCQKTDITLGWIHAIAYLVYVLLDVLLSSIVNSNSVPECLDLCNIYTRNNYVLVFIIFSILIIFALFLILLLPHSGYYNGNVWCLNDKEWKIWNWRFRRSDRRNY